MKNIKFKHYIYLGVGLLYIIAGVFSRTHHTGFAGHFFVIMALLTAFLAAYAYFFAEQKTNTVESFTWQRIGKLSFYLHVSSVLGIGIALFYLIHTHQYQYFYVWNHSSNDLPWYYMISCFWEGQEGSFWLWMFWHSIIGLVLIKTAKHFENRVLSILSSCQFVLASMLLGTYIFGIKIGSDPFIFMKDANPDLPVYKINPNFVPKDGKGLNPLLQNYWMVIHPPTLFLGFALMIVPFAYCMAGLWKKEFDAWIKPAMPWNILAVAVLGLGILMGGYWAYVTLNFGGYWNWDPVENASYVPWLIGVASIHTMIIYKHSKNALRTTFILVIAAWMLILYSTFLTRSGILGNSSVHSFTDLGLSGQLLLFIFLFLGLSVGLLVYRFKHIPITDKEIKIYHREFWLFIGVVILVLSAFQVIIPTSLPVFNKIFGTNAALADPIQFYSEWQLWLMVLLATASGIAQWVFWQKTSTSVFKSLMTPLSITYVLTALIILFIMKPENDVAQYLGQLTYLKYIVLLLAACFTVVSNLMLILTILKRNISIAGGAVAHIGVGLMLIGILFSSGYNRVISINTNENELGKGFATPKDRRENVLLIKDQPRQMGDYLVTYKGEEQKGIRTIYEIEFQQSNGKTFTLYPVVDENPRMGDAPRPAIKTKIDGDIYVHITSIPNPEAKRKAMEIRNYTVQIGDTIDTGKSYLILEGLNTQVKVDNPEQYDIAVGAKIKAIGTKQIADIEPIYLVEKNSNTPTGQDVEFKETGEIIRFMQILPEQRKIVIQVEPTKSVNADWVVLKAMRKPLINVLWLGTGLLMVGFGLAIRRRIKEYRKIVDAV
ncbi:MAG: cytochrome c biogenesis protein CcsA [Bacteroidia bacterium]|nr:cytochrome c biogenesis protein CcsA [Bacteroidia bacterium]